MEENQVNQTNMAPAAAPEVAPAAPAAVPAAPVDPGMVSASTLPVVEPMPAVNEIPDVAPVVPEATAAAPVAEVPATPAVGVPAAPAPEVAVQAPVAEVPATPVAEVPATPAMEVPAVPAPEVAVPVVEAPAAPTVEVPAAPVPEVAPAVEVPVAAPEAAVQAPVAEVPVTPTVEVPAAPAVEVPVTPTVEVAPAPEVVPEQTEPVVEINYTQPSGEVITPPAEVAPAPEVTTSEAPATVPEGNGAAQAPADGTAPDGEKKKSKLPLIIIGIVAVIAIVVVVIILTSKGEEDSPTPSENNTTVVTKPDIKFYKGTNGNTTYELALYEDGTFLLSDSSSTTGAVGSGTYNITDTDITLNKTKEYSPNTCYILRNRVEQKLTKSGEDLMYTETKLTEKDQDERSAVKEYEDSSLNCTQEPEPVVPVVEVTSITLNATKKSLKIGKSFQLKATIKPKNADDKKVTFTVDKPEIATVDEKGNIKAVAAGTAIVTVSHATFTPKDPKKLQCTVTVTEEKKEEETSSSSSSSSSTALNKPNCTDYDVEKVNIDGSGQYNRYSTMLEDLGQETGTKAIEKCITLADLTKLVKDTVRAEAEKCWKDEYVKKAVDKAARLLSPTCTDPDCITKKTLIVNSWEAHSCGYEYK